MIANSFLEKKLNLKAMILLIADGNDFSRSFTRNICRSFRFADILVASNADEALDHLQATEIDMMIVDWLLKPAGGGAFCREARRNPGVRNPVLPIIVLSGTTEREIVAEARDAGANEFMSRPFDLGQLLQRFDRVLSSPRPFVRCTAYVGPDRRRQQRPYPGRDRRVGAAGNGLSRPPTLAATAAKAARSGGQTLGEMAAAGEKVIITEEVRYRDVRRQDLDDMTQLYQVMQRITAPDQAVIEQIYLKSHALKAMGQTFGFPLLTGAGDSLCRMLWKLDLQRMLAPLTIQGVGAHISTMRLIVDQDIRHDGGTVGSQLIGSLHTLVGLVMGLDPSAVKPTLEKVDD
jgi:two-component system chemotaxis response regulator CheY